MPSMLFALIVFTFGLFEKDFWWAITRGFVAFVFCVAIEGLYLSYVMFSISKIAKSFYNLLSLVFA